MYSVSKADVERHMDLSTTTNLFLPRVKNAIAMLLPEFNVLSLWASCRYTSLPVPSLLFGEQGWIGGLGA